MSNYFYILYFLAFTVERKFSARKIFSPEVIEKCEHRSGVVNFRNDDSHAFYKCKLHSSIQPINASKNIKKYMETKKY